MAVNNTMHKGMPQIKKNCAWTYSSCYFNSALELKSGNVTGR